jgi:KipI family sensor histidine kinase inhibitor
MKLEFCDVAEGAAMVECPEATEAEANRAAVALGEQLLSAPLEGLRDAVPGARTLALFFDPETLGHEALRREVAAQRVSSAPSSAGRVLSIPVLYGGEMGPDLPELASRAGLTPEELARRHAAGEYTAAFLGFAPGFAYLTGLDPGLHAPRRATPRPRVPAGSVAIGGPYTGVYPAATPGGWNLIGRSPVRLFDEEAEPPALLRAGDHVRFESIGAARFSELEGQQAQAGAVAPTSPGGRPAFRLVRPGVFTSVQGEPLCGRGAAGLPPGGAMDGQTLRRGNALLGNAPGARALEMTLLGPELEAMSDASVCVSGAPMPVERNGVAASAERPLRVLAGDRLRFGAARGGVRAYLCVEGGLQAPGRLGLTRRLETGHILMAELRGRAEGGGSGRQDFAAPEPEAGDLLLRVILEPRRERSFEEKSVERFLDTPFRVSSTSDRRGIRLEGGPVHARAPEIPPEATALGTIQVPPDGQPILLGPDRPVTGGYARLATVISADWPRIAQAPPGRTVRFAAVSLSEALRLRGTISLP